MVSVRSHVHILTNGYIRCAYSPDLLQCSLVNFDVFQCLTIGSLKMMTSADRQTKQYTLLRNPHTAAGQAISIHDSVPTRSAAAALRVTAKHAQFNRKSECCGLPPSLTCAVSRVQKQPTRPPVTPTAQRVIIGTTPELPQFTHSDSNNNLHPFFMVSEMRQWHVSSPPWLQILSLISLLLIFHACSFSGLRFPTNSVIIKKLISVQFFLWPLSCIANFVLLSYQPMLC